MLKRLEGLRKRKGAKSLFPRSHILRFDYDSMNGCRLSHRIPSQLSSQPRCQPSRVSEQASKPRRPLLAFLFSLSLSFPFLPHNLQGKSLGSLESLGTAWLFLLSFPSLSLTFSLPLSSSSSSSFFYFDSFQPSQINSLYYSPFPRTMPMPS